jgi:hypothetical protein
LSRIAYFRARVTTKAMACKGGGRRRGTVIASFGNDHVQARTSPTSRRDRFFGGDHGRPRSPVLHRSDHRRARRAIPSRRDHPVDVGSFPFRRALLALLRLT